MPSLAILVSAVLVLSCDKQTDRHIDKQTESHTDPDDRLKPRLHQIHVAGYKLLGYSYPGRATCIWIQVDTTCIRATCIWCKCGFTRGTTVGVSKNYITKHIHV